MLHETPATALLARLYLEAVLPALAYLHTADSQARQAAGERPWTVRLKSASGLSATVLFDGQSVNVTSAESTSGLRLQFLDDAR